MITSTLAESILNQIKSNITTMKIKINTNPVTELSATATVGNIMDNTDQKYKYFDVTADFDVTDYSSNSIIQYSLWDSSNVYVWDNVNYPLSGIAQVRIKARVKATYEVYS